MEFKKTLCHEKILLLQLGLSNRKIQKLLEKNLAESSWERDISIFLENGVRL